MDIVYEGIGAIGARRILEVWEACGGLWEMVWMASLKAIIFGLCEADDVGGPKTAVDDEQNDKVYFQAFGQETVLSLLLYSGWWKSGVMWL